MDYELNKLEEMNTWDEVDLTDLPENTQVLPGMWVHTIKISSLKIKNTGQDG